VSRVAARPGRIAAWLDTWPGRITAIAGAIVAVIGVYVAIKNVLPSPDKESRAGFGTVTVVDGIRLSEYRARSGDELASSQVGRPGAGLAVVPALAALLAQAPTSTTTTTPPETTTGDTTQETATTQEPANPDGTTTTGAPTTKDGRRIPLLPDQPSMRAIEKERASAPTVNGVVLPDNGTTASFRTRSKHVLDHAEDRADADTCSSAQRSGLPCDAILPLISAASINADGDPVGDQTTEDRLVELLRHTRTVLVGSGGTRHREPVGVEVTFLIELAGLRDEDVYIRWSIHEAGSMHRLFGKWLATNVAYRLKVNSDDTTRTRNIWVPLPRTKGPFFARLYVASEGDILSFYDTKRFG
jgi:hypothetical protein